MNSLPGPREDNAPKRTWITPELRTLVAGKAELLTGTIDDGPGDKS